MAEPTTSLDERFSEPGATPTPWARTRRVLEDAQLCWITTVRVDGRPHATPRVAVWLDDALHFCTGPAEQKCVNLAADPHVLLSTGDLRWDAGLDVVVEGRAVRVTDDAVLERLAGAWTEKWDGRWRFEVGDGAFRSDGGGQAHVFRVEADKVLAFGQGSPFTHTRYRF